MLKRVIILLLFFTLIYEILLLLQLENKRKKKGELRLYPDGKDGLQQPSWPAVQGKQLLKTKWDEATQ